MSDETGVTAREIEELRTELRRVTSALRLALACSVGVAVATPVMFMVSVSKYLRPSWMGGQEMVVGFWVFLVLLAAAVAWTAILLVRRRTAHLP